jgi:hypothetical protein
MTDIPNGATGPTTGKVNPFSRLAGVIFSPVETLQSISERPDWVVPFIVVMLISIGVNAIIAPHIDIEATVRQQMESRPNATESQIQQAISIGKTIAKFNMIIAIVAVGVVLLVIAGALHLAFRAFAGEGTFGQSWAVTVYSSVPGLLLAIIMTLLASMHGSMTQQDMMLLVKSNPGAFLDPKSNPILFALLKSIDIFTLWRLALLTIGLSFASRLSRGRSAGIVITLWAIVVVFQVAFAAIGVAM